MNRLFCALLVFFLMIAGSSRAAAEKPLVAQLVLPVMQKESLPQEVTPDNAPPEAKPMTPPAAIQTDSLPENLQPIIRDAFAKAPTKQDLSQYPAVDPKFDENKALLESLPATTDGIAHPLTDRVVFDYRMLGSYDHPSPFYGVLDMHLNTEFLYLRKDGKLIGVEVYDRPDFPRAAYDYLMPNGVLKGVGIAVSLEEGYGYTLDGKMLCHFNQGRCYTQSGEPIEAKYAAYIMAVRKKIIAHWKPVQVNHPYAILALFTIDKHGKLSSLTVQHSNAQKSDENLGLAAIRQSAPFPPLPDSYPFEKFQMTFSFVNMGGPLTASDAAKQGLIRGKNNKLIRLRSIGH